MHNEKQWLAQLSRRGWAWEFLRRNPLYQADCRLMTNTSEVAGKWGLLHLCDPSIEATAADVYWRPEDSLDVLSLSICPNRPSNSVALQLQNLSCQVAIRDVPAEGRRDILFRDHGRFLQLAVSGEGDLENANLVVAALDNPKAIMARTAALRRLNDLLFTKTMRPILYPSESRAPRLITVLTALDGWLAQMPQRDIALLMYNKARVAKEWPDPRQNLRDQVRRAIGYGQELMNGGYRQFLHLTFARRIAARQKPQL